MSLPTINVQDLLRSEIRERDRLELTYVNGKPVITLVLQGWPDPPKSMPSSVTERRGNTNRNSTILPDAIETLSTISDISSIDYEGDGPGQIFWDRSTLPETPDVSIIEDEPDPVRKQEFGRVNILKNGGLPTITIKGIKRNLSSLTATPDVSIIEDNPAPVRKQQFGRVNILKNGGLPTITIKGFKRNL